MSETIQSIKKTRDMFKPVLETQIIGLGRVLLGLPIEHFFDRFKTQIQAEQSRSSFKELFQNIIKKNGIRQGIFAGFSSQMTIQLCKQYYRWPMMIFIPRYFKEHLPTNLVNNHPAIHKIMAGATIAVFESIITCPFERVKCQLMTQNTQKSVFLQLFHTEPNAKSLLKNLYTGIEIMMLKQIISWTNYLYWDHKIRYLFKESPNHALSMIQCLQCSFLTAVPNILLVQPFDTVKTLYQMENNQQYKALSIVKACAKLYQEKGMIAFYSGWKVRMTQFVVQAILTTPVMDYLERLHGLPQI